MGVPKTTFDKATKVSQKNKKPKGKLKSVDLSFKIENDLDTQQLL